VRVPLLVSASLILLRHSNDFEDIRRISILPTSDEVLCGLVPYLPKGPSMHLPPGSEAAYIDRQFRWGTEGSSRRLCWEHAWLAVT